MAANNEDGIVTKICYICGSMNSTVTCQQCNKMLCISCDRLYHSHPTRTKHIRNIKDTHQVKSSNLPQTAFCMETPLQQKGSSNFEGDQRELVISIPPAVVAAKGHHTHASQPVSLLPKQKINEDQRPQTSNHTMIEKQPDFSHNVRLAQSSNTVKKHLVSYSSTATDDLKNKSDHEKELQSPSQQPEWMCEYCTYINTPNSIKCKICKKNPKVQNAYYSPNMTQDQAKISAETRNYPLVSTDYSLVQSTNHTSIVSKLEQQSIAKQFETSENVKGIKEMHNQEVGAINITNEPGTANESKGVKTNSVIQATTTMVSREHLEPSKQKETVKTPQSIHLGSDKLQRVIESQTANAMVYKESQTSSINQVPTAMVPKDLMGAINQNEIAGITEKIIVDIEHLHRQTVWQQDTSMVSKNVNMKSMNQPEITMAYNDVCSSAFNSLETATPSQNIKCDIDEVDERTHQKAGTGLVSKDFSVDILNQQGVSDTTQRIYMTGDEQYEETHERTGTAIISKDFHGDVLARSS